LTGVEAAGTGLDAAHGASVSAGTPGVLHGALSLVLQDDDGLISPAHSISAGLDYPGVGPEHAWLAASGRARYVAITDDDALRAFRTLADTEGILPALEPAHAIAHVMASATEGELVLVGLSGRGDKDVASVADALGAGQ
jgi:tryptophan synthase beta chain